MNQVAENTQVDDSQEVSQESQATPSTPEESKVRVIEANNPTPEQMTEILENIKVNYDFNVNTKPTEFKFKRSKDKDTGIESVRETVVLAVPYPSMDGVIAILEAGGKGLDLLFEAMEDVVNSAARALLYEDTTYNATTFPVDKLSWEFIATMPKPERRGGGIPKETWEGFSLDYVAIMPEAAGKTIDQVSTAVKLLNNKLASVKTNEVVLNVLVQQLAIYSEHSPNFSEYSECVEFLLNKADTFLNMSDEDLLANL